MKLYITPASPYARMARIVVIEKGLESRVEIIRAQTRLTDSPSLQDQSVGRVFRISSVTTAPAWRNPLVICAYLDQA